MATAIKTKIGDALVDRERLRELRRARTDLFYLAGKLGYTWKPKSQQGLTEHLHKDECARMDSLRFTSRTGLLMPRKTLKSTVFTICLAVQEILRDPDTTILVLHMSEIEAEKIVEEIAGHFMKSKGYLRDLDGGIKKGIGIGVYPEDHKDAGKYYKLCPHPSHKKWLTSKGFRITQRPGLNPTTARQPTCVGKGITSTLTGIHADLVFYDDIIGLETLADSTGMNKVRDVHKSTMTNVLNPTGRIRLVGTRWDEYDVYADFIKSKYWDIRVRHAIELEPGVMGEIDPRTGTITAGEVIHYGPTPKGTDGIRDARKREALELDEMGLTVYSAQRMNDPSPAGEKPWVSADCEHYISLKEAAGPGRIFILSDPAPARVGSYTGSGEKTRGDGTKDDWAWCAVKLQVHGSIQRAVLLDLDHSKEWERSVGLTECAHAMQKWRTNMFFNEMYGGLSADYSEDMKKICRELGISLYTVRVGGSYVLPPFKNSYVKAAKNQRFGALADWAKAGRFAICESVSEERVEAFLAQARGWKPNTSTGGNSLRHDDIADVISRCTDAALQEFAPKPDYSTGTELDDLYSPYRQPKEQEELHGSRYVKW